MQYSIHHYATDASAKIGKEIRLGADKKKYLPRTPETTDTKN